VSTTLFPDAVTIIVFAFFTGIISAMIGVGGGFLIVPSLVLLFNLPFQQAAGTSLAMIVFTAVSSTLAYVRQRRIDYGLGLLLTLGSVPGGVVGAALTQFIAGKALSAAFGVFLSSASLRMVFSKGSPTKETKPIAKGWRRSLVDAAEHKFEYAVNPLRGLGLGFLGGLVSGLFGVGGGVVMVPAMRLILGVPMHLAVATSMFIMIFTSLSGVLTHLTLGNVLPEYVLYLALGVIIGTQIGAFMAWKTRERRLQMVFGSFMLLIGVRMLLEYLIY